MIKISRRIDDRTYHPLYGTPLYDIQGCQYQKDCSYPYCDCLVPHDRNDKPYRDEHKSPLHIRLWTWVWVLCFCCAFWIVVGIALWRFLS